MEKIIGIAQMIVPVFLMIVIGALSRSKGIVSKQGIAGLKSLVVNIALPAVLLKAFYNTTYGLEMVIIAACLFLCCCGALGLGFVFKKTTHSTMRTVPFLMTGFEAGMLGYALYTLLFGAGEISYFATVDLGQVLFVFTVFLSMLNPVRRNGSAVKAAFKNIVKSPVILAIALGILIGASGLGKRIDASAAGGIVQNTLTFISAPTAAVILLVVGYELELKKLNIKAVLSLVVVRYALMGALCFLAGAALSAVIPMSVHLKWALILLFTLPPPFVIPIFIDDEKENASISAALSLCTAISLALFAIIAFIVA